MTTNDPIQPAHYKLTTRDGKTVIECIDAQEFLDLGPGSHLSNALKYAWRFGRKAENGLTQDQQLAQDVAKSRWYLARFHAKHGVVRNAMPKWLSSRIDLLPIDTRRFLINACSEQHTLWLELAGHIEAICADATAHIRFHSGEHYDVTPLLRSLIEHFDMQF